MRIADHQPLTTATWSLKMAAENGCAENGCAKKSCAEKSCWEVVVLRRAAEKRAAETGCWEELLTVAARRAAKSGCWKWLCWEWLWIKTSLKFFVSRKWPRKVPSKKALSLKTVIKDCHLSRLSSKATQSSAEVMAVFKDYHQTSLKVLLKWWLSLKIVINYRPKFCWSDGCL